LLNRKRRKTNQLAELDFLKGPEVDHLPTVTTLAAIREKIHMEDNKGEPAEEENHCRPMEGEGRLVDLIVRHLVHPLYHPQDLHLWGIEGLIG